MQSSWSVLTHHFSHLKGVVAFCKSACLLCSKALMVMSLHAMDDSHWPFSVEPPSRDYLSSVCRKLVPSSSYLLQSHSYRHLLHVWACNTSLQEPASMSESSTFSLGASWESDEAWSPMLQQLSAAVPSSGSAMALVGLEGGLAVSCCMLFRAGSLVQPLVLVLACFYHPMWELWLLPALTSLESM